LAEGQGKTIAADRMRSAARLRAASQIGQTPRHFNSWNRTTKEPEINLFRRWPLKGKTAMAKNSARTNISNSTLPFSEISLRHGNAVENLPLLRKKLEGGIVDRYLDVQQDILETFVDREQLRNSPSPRFFPNGGRIPGLKLDQPRQLALLHSLVRFCYPTAEGTFATRELYPQMQNWR
jgi:hypothetical protein